jgi:hypothetical protein
LGSHLVESESQIHGDAIARLALYIDLLQPDAIIAPARDPIFQFENPYIETLCRFWRSYPSDLYELIYHQ